LRSLEFNLDHFKVVNTKKRADKANRGATALCDYSSGGMF
jgi:hypothetical protein